MRPLFTLPALAIASILHAQVTLNTGSLSALPGESFTYEQIPWAAQGAGGTGQTWDFSTILSSSPFTFDWITPYASTLLMYPNCTVEKTTSGYFEHYEAAVDAFVELGNFYGFSLTTVALTDPRDEIRYPFSFGSSYTDSYGGITWYPDGLGLGGYDTAVVAGTWAVTADGEGILILPWATFTDVLRLHVEKDAITGPSDTTHTDEYRFVTPGVHAPLLRMYEISYTSLPTVQQLGRVLMPGSTATPEAVAANVMNVTHADGQLCITGPALDGPVHVELIGVDGRILQQWTLGASAGNQRTLLPVTSMAVGVHLVRLIGRNGGSCTARVLIAR